MLPINIGKKYLNIPYILLRFRNTIHYESNFWYHEIRKFHEVEIRDMLYHQTISNEINFTFLIISFGKMSFSKSLPSSGTESKMERMSDF